jgi:hypothetical protein
MRFYYRFNYECVSQKTITAVEAVLAKTAFDCSMQYADTGMMILIVRESPTTAKKITEFIQAEIWKRNGGMLCEYIAVEEDNITDYL